VSRTRRGEVDLGFRYLPLCRFLPTLHCLFRLHQLDLIRPNPPLPPYTAQAISLPFPTVELLPHVLQPRLPFNFPLVLLLPQLPPLFTPHCPSTILQILLSDFPHLSHLPFPSHLSQFLLQLSPRLSPSHLHTLKPQLPHLTLTKIIPFSTRLQLQCLQSRSSSACSSIPLTINLLQAFLHRPLKQQQRLR